MGSLSDFAENALVNHILKNTAYTPVATLYVGLSTADPLDDGSGLAEPVGNGYTRQAITFAAAANRQVVQSGDVQFATATGLWGDVSHYAIFDAASGGNMLAPGSLNAVKTVSSGKAPSIAAGSIILSITTGAWSNYLANLALDFMFRNQSFAQPTNIYVALVETTEITDSATGSTIDELDMTGYARELNNTWDAAVAGASANTAEIDFGQLTAGGSEIATASALLDAVTGGNILVYDNSPNMQIDDNDTVKFPAGDWDVSLN